MSLEFPFNLYLLGGGGAFLASLCSLPFWRRFAQRTGFVDDPGHRKIHSTPVPLAGGWTVLGALAMTMLCGAAAVKFGWIDWGGTQEALRYGVGRRSGQLLAILIGALGMAMVGALDDKYELRPAIKFGGQLLIASFVALAGVRITLFVPSAIFSFVVTVLWILTVTNAANFLDNMNGLCAGIGAIGAWACAWSAAIQGQYLVAIFAFAAFGALLGFLPHNYPRATAFLGDGGSHLVGYLLATLAILPHFYSNLAPRTLTVLSPLLILAVPLADLVWVVLLRWKIGQPFYVGDTNHISHRLVRRGLSKSTAVALIWLFSALAAAVSFLL